MKTALLLAFASAAASAQAAITWVPALGGNVTTDEWPVPNSLNYPGNGGFPGASPWAGPLASSSPNDAELVKVSNGTGGGPYPATDSMYFGGFDGSANVNGGTLAVRDATAISSLMTVVFQIEIGEAFTYDFFNHGLPTLSYNGGNQGLAATYSSVYEKVFNGTILMPTGPGGTDQEEPLYNNTYALQWDLSGIAEPISSFSVQFTGVQHAQLYDISLHQSDALHSASILPAAVPEPGVVGLLGLSALGLLRRRR